MTTSICQIDSYGTKRWVIPSTCILHREDGPAAEYTNGNTHWYLHGKLHHVDGPAIWEPQTGYQAWFLYGKLHRENGPAIIDSYGSYFWYYDGLLHRDEGPAVEMFDGRKAWSHYGNSDIVGQIKCLTIALSPLELPPYIVLWILEWSHPNIQRLNQPRLVALLEGIRNSRLKLKGLDNEIIS